MIEVVSTGDWSRSQPRRAWIQGPRSHLVRLQAPPVSPSPSTPSPLSPAERAHWRMRWRQRISQVASTGIAASYPESIGEPYEDASGNRYMRLIGQPMLVYGGDSAALARVLERALARGIQPAIYTEEMFSTTHDAANREAVRCVERANLNLVGIAIRAERKAVDKIVDKLKFHE